MRPYEIDCLQGQVGGVGLSSAIFQSSLDTELHKGIVGEGAQQVNRIS